MTRGDIIVKVVAEITGEPVGKVHAVVKRTFGAADFAEELAHDDAKNAIASFREDPSDLLSLYAANKGELEPRRPDRADER